MNNYKNLQELKMQVLGSTNIQNEIKKNPVDFFQSLETEKPIDHPYVFLSVIGIVGITLFAAVIIGGIIALQAPEMGTDREDNPIIIAREIPDFIIMLGSTALGTLAGLLVPTPKNENG